MKLEWASTGLAFATNWLYMLIIGYLIGADKFGELSLVFQTSIILSIVISSPLIEDFIEAGIKGKGCMKYKKLAIVCIALCTISFICVVISTGKDTFSIAGVLFARSALIGYTVVRTEYLKAAKRFSSAVISGQVISFLVLILLIGVMLSLG